MIAPKRKRRLDGVDQVVLSLTARGLTTGEIAAHFDEVYGAKVFKDAISQITEKVSAELAEWSSRPLNSLYPVIFVDAIVVKVGDGQVRNTPFYVVMGVTVNGTRDILGIWAGDGQEGARFWLQVFTEVKNRGVEDVLIAVCDGLKGSFGGDQHHLGANGRPAVHRPPDPQQLALRRAATPRPDRPFSSNPSTQPRQSRRQRIGSKSSPPSGARGTRRSCISGSAPGQRYVPFLEYDVKIRRVICTTNAIELINTRYRQAVQARGHFPNEAAAIKCLYLVTPSLDPTRGKRARWVMK